MTRAFVHDLFLFKFCCANVKSFLQYILNLHLFFAGNRIVESSCYFHFQFKIKKLCIHFKKEVL